MSDVLQIDLSKIDSEITRLQEQYNLIKEELDAKLLLKEQLISAFHLYGVNPNGSLELTTNDRGQFEISEYLLNYLKINGDSQSSVIINDYCRITGKSTDQARSNVSNALSRLKVQEKVAYKRDGEGRSLWFLK